MVRLSKVFRASLRDSISSLSLLLNEKRGDFFCIGDFHPVFLTQTKQGGIPGVSNGRVFMNDGDGNQIMRNRPPRAGIKNVTVPLVPGDRNNACKCLMS